MKSTQLPLPEHNRGNASTCGYKNHPMKPFSGYCYTDIEHGVLENTNICRECYAEHILKFYPDSRIAEYIRTNPSQYTNTNS